MRQKSRWGQCGSANRQRASHEVSDATRTHGRRESLANDAEPLTSCAALFAVVTPGLSAIAAFHRRERPTPPRKSDRSARQLTGRAPGRKPACRTDAGDTTHPAE